ncbi:hypothetical protein [Candidatus Magnetomonas plexicatena]|uniref:hypothetical protein n=1 Tax=Candidatus Magnetomonas plexicatena TaxID=2552947 RepID=UPI001C7893F6|nr:hypothetical protein E2O03_005435 [Nitrospirales bacterium LBB_01]
MKKLFLAMFFVLTVAGCAATVTIPGPPVVVEPYPPAPHPAPWHPPAPAPYPPPPWW